MKRIKYDYELSAKRIWAAQSHNPESKPPTRVKQSSEGAQLCTSCSPHDFDRYMLNSPRNGCVARANIVQSSFRPFLASLAADRVQKALCC